MRIFITGATGLIGRRLVDDRLSRGDQLTVLSRRREKAMQLFAAASNPNVMVVEGDPAEPGDWQRSIDGHEAVVHLAGAGVADKRWTDTYKRELIDSRVDSTYQVVTAMQQATRKPGVFVCSSAVGYYGETGETETDETSPAGDDFLAQLCVDWEQQARAAPPSTRTVMLRTGVYLDPRGGALGQMLPIFRLGIAGRLGSGKQFMPWIHWRDHIALIDLALRDDRCIGPLNLTAPQPVRNKVFTRELASALGRPALLPAPKFALRIALGEFANYLLTSQRIVPANALQLGYHFLYPELELAFQSLLTDSSSADDSAHRSAPVAVPSTTLEKNFTSADEANTATPPARVRLLAIDVDGTLLRTDGNLSQGVIEACRAAEQAGCVIVLVSARPPRGVAAIIQTLGTTGPTINYNGALIWNPRAEKPQYHEPLPGELAAEIVAVARQIEPEVLVGIEVLDRFYTDRYDEMLESQASRLVEPDAIGPLEPRFAEPVTKLNFIGSPQMTSRLMKTITERYWRPKKVAVFPTDPRLIQITSPMVDKGIALQRIAKRLGASREQVMAIGDAPNDMGMIEWAGFGVAVANAPKNVQELADAVVPSNNDHGVARAIQRYVFEQIFSKRSTSLSASPTPGKERGPAG